MYILGKLMDSNANKELLEGENKKQVKLRQEFFPDELVNYDAKKDNYANLSTDFSNEDSYHKYENEIKATLESKNYNLEQTLYLDQIIQLLDILNGNEPFNRVLLMHIVE